MHEKSKVVLSTLLLNLWTFALLAQDVDFVLNESSMSYHHALANEIEIDYIQTYLSRSSDNIATLFHEWADSFAIIGMNFPPLGQPHVPGAAGVCMGLGEYSVADWNDAGMRIFDAGAGGLVDISLFCVLSMDAFFERPPGLLEKTDISLSFNHVHLTGFEDVRLNFYNLGIVLRKQILSEIGLIGKLAGISGVAVTMGVQYAGVSGREDDIGNGFYSDAGNLEPPEVVFVEESTGGTVTVSAPISVAVPSYVHYPYLESHYFAIHAGVKGYLNIAGFLDIFSGFSAAWIPYNCFYADVSSDVNLKLTDNQGVNTRYDGRITIQHTASGSHLMPMIQLGAQFNVGPVKIPFQITQTLTHDNKSTTAGLYLTF